MMLFHAPHAQAMAKVAAELGDAGDEEGGASQKKKDKVRPVLCMCMHTMTYRFEGQCEASKAFPANRQHCNWRTSTPQWVHTGCTVWGVYKDHKHNFIKCVPDVHSYTHITLTYYLDNSLLFEPSGHI